jgi:hypothetical protein
VKLALGIDPHVIAAGRAGIYDEEPLSAVQCEVPECTLQGGRSVTIRVLLLWHDAVGRGAHVRR